MTRTSLFSLVIASLLSACGGDKLPAECYTRAGCSPDQETDADTDTDTDSDADADTDTDTDPPDEVDDEDGDGYTEDDGDCDDTNAEVHPNAEETCDGIDNNCVDGIDEGCDTGTTDDYAACLAEAFHGTDQTYGGTVDDSVAVLADITSFPADGWSWVDAEVARIMDASDGSGFETDLRIPQSGLCGGSQTAGTMDVTEVEESEKSDPDNGLIITIQPDGTWVEINQYRECGDGTFEGWKLPGGDGEALPICGNSAWGPTGYGGHGGSHLPILPGMVTIADIESGNLDWGHLLHVEFDNSILGCPDDVCYVAPAKSADTGASANYHGTLPMGAWPKVDSDYDCTQLVTYYAKAWCTTAKRGMIPVDRSNENDEPEIQFVIENGVDELVQEVDGESLFNNNGQIAADMDTLFETDTNGTLLNVHRVMNPEVAYTNYNE